MTDCEDIGMEEEGKSTFGIKKIVDCKIGKCGRQLYKVKWVATWEPADNLTSVQHLIDEFWTYVENAKTQETVAQQHLKRIRLSEQQKHHPHPGVVVNNQKLPIEKNNQVQNLVARTSETTAARNITMNNLNAHFPVDQDVTAHFQKSLQNVTQPTSAGNVLNSASNALLNFNPALKASFSAFSVGISGQNKDDQKVKMPVTGNKRPIPPFKADIDDSKSLVDAKIGDISAKTLNNSGLKYLENFENPYVKILLACKKCNKEQSLKYPATWKRHFLTHADKEDLPHKCTFCDKRFVTSTNLKNHMKTHTKGTTGGGVAGAGGGVAVGGGGVKSGGSNVKKEEPWYGTQQQF